MVWPTTPPAIPREIIPLVNVGTPVVSRCRNALKKNTAAKELAAVRSLRLTGAWEKQRNPSRPSSKGKR